VTQCERKRNMLQEILFRQLDRREAAFRKYAQENIRLRYQVVESSPVCREEWRVARVVAPTSTCRASLRALTRCSPVSGDYLRSSVLAQIDRSTKENPGPYGWMKEEESMAGSRFISMARWQAAGVEGEATRLGAGRRRHRAVGREGKGDVRNYNGQDQTTAYKTTWVTWFAFGRQAQYVAERFSPRRHIVINDGEMEFTTYPKKDKPEPAM